MAKTPYYTKAESEAKIKESFRGLQNTTARYAFDTLQEAKIKWASFSQAEKDELDGKEFSIYSGENKGVNIWDSATSGGVKFRKSFGVEQEDVDFSGPPPENENLFDKSEVSEGYVLIDTGEIVSNSSSAVSGFIKINPAATIYCLRTWNSGPNGYALYDENKTFITYKTSSVTPPGGLMDNNKEGAHYLRMNVWSSSGSTTLQENIDNLMIYWGSELISYQPYKGFFNTIKGKRVFIPNIDPKKLEALIVNHIPKDSDFSSISQAEEDSVGIFKLRYAGDSITTNETGILTSLNTSNGSNPCLWAQGYFPSDYSGKSFKLKGKIKYTEGSDRLSFIAAGSAFSPYLFPSPTTDWQEIDMGIVFGDFYEDMRFMIYLDTINGTPTSSSFYLKDLRLESVSDPYKEAVDPREAVQDEGVNYLPTYNLGAMPNFRYKAAQLPGDVVLSIGILGDSWTQSVPNSINYARDLSKLLRVEYGNGGGGFYDFSSSTNSQFMRSIDIDDATDTRSGTITYKDQTPDSKGVNVAHAEFDTGSTLTLNVLTAHTNFVIHYYGGSGSFRYRIDGGAWQDVDASTTTGHSTIEEPVSDATHTIEFEVLTGPVILLGVDMQRSSGIRVHKLGNRGSRAYNYGEINADDWKAAITTLNLDALTVLIGTNDRTVGRTTQQFGEDISYLVDMARTAIPYLDIALISPSNNRNAAATEMVEFAKEKFKVAQELNLPFLDLIPLFGSREQIIEKGTFYDSVHPTTEGGKMIADYIFNKLL